MEKKQIINNVLYANNSRESGIIVEPYNVVLTTGDLVEYSNLVLMNSNAGLSNYCQVNKMIKSPTIRDYNKLNSKSISHFLHNFINFDDNSMLQKPSLDSIVNSLIPYKRLHYVLPAYTSTKSNDSSNPNTVTKSLTNEVFSPASYLCHTPYKKKIFGN